MFVILVPILFVLFVCRESVDGATFNPAHKTGRCLTLPSDSDYQRINPCAGIVNYAYFSFGTLTPKFLETTARTKLSAALLTQLSQDTLNSLVRLTCANIYLKCYNNVDVTNTSTYNYQIYQFASSITFGVPFYRPCVTVCAPAFTTQTASIVLLSASGSLPSCTATFDYTYSNGAYASAIATYESNSANIASGKCFVPGTRTFAVASETYKNNGGPCDGFVGTKFVTPPANVLNTSYAALQTTGVPQTILTAQVTKNLPNFPNFVTSECRKAFKSYVCHSAFLNPVSVTFGQAAEQNGIPSTSITNAVLRNYALSLPQFPYYDECVNFKTTCARILTIAGRSINCSAVAATSTVGARSFPEKKQVVTSVYVSSVSLTLKISTSPNNNTYYNATTDATTYTESCPGTFVVPEHPDNPDVQWVKGTACAVNCKAPVWTTSEWDQYINKANRLPIAGTIFGLLTLIYIVYRKMWEENYLIIAYTIIALVASLQTVNFTRSHSFDDRMCVDNAVNETQGQRHSPCVTQGIVLHYTILACSAVILCMAIERLLVHHSLTDYTRHPVYLLGQILLVFFYPIIPVAIVAGSSAYGFSKSQSYCFILSSVFGPDYLDTGLGGLPVLIAYGLSYTIIFASALYLWRIWIPMCPTRDTRGSWKSPHSGVSCYDVLKGIDPYLALILFSAFVYVPYFAFWGQNQLHQKEYQSQLQTWIQCVFRNWDGSTDSSYESVCGEHVKTRPSNIGNPYLNFVLTSNMIVIGPAFIIFHAIHHYLNEPHEVYNPLPTYSKKRLLSKTFISGKEEEGSNKNTSNNDFEGVAVDGEGELVVVKGLELVPQKDVDATLQT
eukprot:gene1830-1959_t